MPIPHSIPLLCIVLLVITGCGYRPLLATFPEGDGAIHIPMVDNRTSYIDLGGILTSELRHQASAVGIRVVSSTKAPSLVVTITRVHEQGGMMARDGKEIYFVDTIHSITAEARIIRKNGTVLLPVKQFELAGRSISDVDVAARTALAHTRRGRILEELATQIVEYMFYRYP